VQSATQNSGRQIVPVNSGDQQHEARRRNWAEFFLIGMCTQEKAEDPCALVLHSLVFVVLQTKHCTLTVGTLHLHTYQKEKDAALRELATYKEREAMAACEINMLICNHALSLAASHEAAGAGHSTHHPRDINRKSWQEVRTISLLPKRAQWV